MPKSIRLLIFLFFSATSASAETLTGRVTVISDGDTLKLLTPDHRQVKVRLAAIDAPEKEQAFGQRSKQSLADLCFGKPAVVEVVDIDRYGRTVGTVICSGTSANDAQVKAGMAWVYRKYAEGFGYLYPFEEDAKTEKRGLWMDPKAIEPWVWRKAKRS